MVIDLKWRVFKIFLNFYLVGGDIIKRFLGHHCEIVYKQTDDKKSTVTGDVMDLNNAGFILLENQDVMHFLNICKIILIKNREKTIGEKL
jgi:hypothetical protein